MLVVSSHRWSTFVVVHPLVSVYIVVECIISVEVEPIFP